MGKVQNIVIIDNAGEVRMALWDNKCDIIEQKNIKIGDIIKINGATTKASRDGGVELSLGLHGIIDVDNSGENESKFPAIKHAEEATISSISTSNDEVTITAKLIDKRGIVEFDRDGKKGRVMNAVVKDLTGSIQLTLWNESIDKFNFEVGDTVKLTDLRVGTRNEEIQLTFNSYSTANKIDKSEFDSIKVYSGQVVPTIKELEDKMNNITVLGKLSEIGELKQFDKNGETRKLQNITVYDSTAAIRMTLWGDDISILSKLNTSDVLKIENVRTKINNYTKEIELVFNNNSKISVETDIVEDKFKLSEDSISLNEVTETISGVTVKGIVTKIFDPREVEFSDGRQAKVMNFNIQDSNGNSGKVAVWNEQISKVSSLEEGNGITLKNVRVKPNEEYPPEIAVNSSTIINITEGSDLGPILQTADSYMKTTYEKKNLSDHLIDGSKVRVQGTIVNIFAPAFYDGCNTCDRKINIEEGSDIGTCSSHGEVSKKVKIIITLTLDDSVSTIIAKFFNKNAEKLIGMSGEEAKEKTEKIDPNATTEELKMNDLWIEGKVATNKEREEQYITVNNFGKIDYSEETNNTLQRMEGW